MRISEDTDRVPEPAGAETFGRSRSWRGIKFRLRLPAPAPGETKSKRLFRQYGSGGQVTFKK
jgi:hypothetical protein